MMDRTGLQVKLDELMRQYDVGGLDGDAYAQKLMDLAAPAQE
ncbi:hypothetical protein [Nesterenkonia massiliensis]|nr:hypothetical protein [Nesterenkonia massiliensis]